VATEDSKPDQNLDLNDFTAGGEGSPTGKPLPVQFRDKVLLTTWIFSYAAILWIFNLITRFESVSALKSSQKGRLIAEE
jgi:hypothetical protein